MYNASYTTVDLFTLPLQGISFIEAAAGTGKTYTLAAIYLRLLLGLGGETAYPRSLSVEEILVVTFTETATEELRNRIRENIHQLRLSCLCGHSKDPLLAALLVQLTDTDLAAHQLLAAERQIDKAAIFTIHGFCQRMLSHSFVESRVLFQQKLLKDESFLYQQVSADFWRRYCYPLPVAVASIIRQYWSGPEDLLADLLPYLHGNLPKVCNAPDTVENIITYHEHIISHINKLKQGWYQAKDELYYILLNAQKLDHRIYNSKNLLSWLEKINQWTRKPTINYQVPKVLERFRSSILSEKTTQGIPPHHPVFEAIEEHYNRKFSLRELVFIMAMNEISQTLEQEKYLRSEIGFNDLISYFDRALASDVGEILAKSVRIGYPVAMIDEFQDTDQQQYRIFRRLYSAQPKCGLLMIGDPKQAIYAFRGADVFTYIHARNEVEAYYTLETNWRSSPGMINAVNQLFQCMPMPFIFREIPFLPVRAASKNASMRLIIQQHQQQSMCFWLQPGNAVGIIEYQQLMARQCAVTIRHWLSAARDDNAWLEDEKGRQLLKASDIVVLVRNRKEAAIMRDELTSLEIPVVYLSNCDSIFEIPEARELLWLLQAILAPEHNNTLRCALATSLLGFDAAAIEAFNTDEHSWEQLIEEFIGYRLSWQERGVLPMLRQIITSHRIAQTLLASNNGKRRLTYLMHLGELLQEASIHLENEHALVRWLAFQIESPNNPLVTNQQPWLESDHQVVKIITIHKSKGLEFPIVFLPFAADFRQQKRPLFHDRQQYQVYLDLSAAPQSMALAEEERLAEDLRLFYVALTRSIYHCSIGITSLSYGKCKKAGNSDLHLSAPGYLIQQGKAGDAKLLHYQLEKLVTSSGGDIIFNYIENPQALPLKSIRINQPLAARHWQAQMFNLWQITSYTILQQNNTPVVMDLQPQLEVNLIIEESYQQQKLVSLTPHTFPRGKSAGTFLHGLFEKLDFTKPLDSQLLNIQLAQNGIDTIWLPVIKQWMTSVINIPLEKNMPSLSHISLKNRNAELKFYLAIDSTLAAQDMDQLCKRYDQLSARCPPLDFPKFNGMLEGCIDLFFRWQGRYYLLDYKSNWLGKDSSVYTQSAMEQAMVTHRYELQYQLYTLALHRFLRHRLVNYDYQHNFGGVFYLFLRGIDTTYPGNGIYSCRPDALLIERLDKMFNSGDIG